VHIRLRDELGIIKAAAKLPAVGGESVDSLPASAREAVGRLLQGGFSLWSRCVCTHVSPAIDQLEAWQIPDLAPGLTETVSQSCLALVKYLSDNHLTEIIGRPGSFRQISISGLRSGLRRCQIDRFWSSAWLLR